MERLRVLHSSPQPGSTLLSRVAASWFASLDNRRRPTTKAGYRLLLDKHVLPAFGHCKIGRIGYEDVDYFVRSLEKSGRRPGTVRTAYGVLKMVLDQAVRESDASPQTRATGSPCSPSRTQRSSPSPGDASSIIPLSRNTFLTPALTTRWASVMMPASALSRQEQDDEQAQRRRHYSGRNRRRCN